MSIQSTINSLLNSLNITTRATRTPATLLMTGTKKRSGFSAKRVAANTIARKGEAGAPAGALPDGQESVEEKMLTIFAEEIYKELLQNSFVEIAIPPQAIQILSNGGNAGGPVVSQGYNILPIKAEGIIR